MRLGLEAGTHTLDLAQELGIAGVPIPADRLVSAGVEEVLRPIHSRGLTVCQIGAFMFNPLSPDAKEQARQADVVRRAIPLARAAGCLYIVIGPGNYHLSGFAAGDPKNFTEEALDAMARALEPLLPLAEEHGAKLSIEPYLKGAIHSAERFLALKERLRSDALRINVDVTSLYTFWDMWDPSPLVERTCASLAGHYGLCHVKDVALADGFHIHIGLAPLKDGVTPWSRVLELVEPHLPSDSWVLLEHVQTPEEARESLGLLRDAAARAGVRLE